MERETGFEPATSCLGSRHSTTELLSLALQDVLYNINFMMDSPVLLPMVCACGAIT